MLHRDNLQDYQMINGDEFIDELCKPTKQELSIFKDGSTFVYRQLELKLDESNKYRFNNFSDTALFGTLFFNVPSTSPSAVSLDTPNSIKSVTSKVESLTRIVEVTNLLTLLEANIGQNVTLNLHEKEKISGCLVQVKQGVVIVKQDNGGWISLDIAQCRSAEFQHNPETSYVSKVSKQSRIIEIEFTQSATNQVLDVCYLQTGISWLPNYFICLLSDDTALISLRALIFNDTHSITDANINLVVGVPNFSYSSQISPLVSNDTIEEFFRKLAYYGGAGARAPPSQSFSQQTISDSGVMNRITSTEGTNSEDLFFYQLSHVDLPKKCRVQKEILTAKVPIQHIYNVRLAKTGRNSNSNPSEIEPEKVYHSIQIENTSGFPWTTGSALVTNDLGTSPISQDQLNYTPNQGSVKLKLTQSPNIYVIHTENELERQSKYKAIPTTPEGHKRACEYLGLRKVEGKIDVKNMKNKPISLNISRDIDGQPQGPSTQFKKISKIVGYNRDGNPTNSVEWEITLQPGETKQISYTYLVVFKE